MSLQAHDHLHRSGGHPGGVYLGPAVLRVYLRPGAVVLGDNGQWYHAEAQSSWASAVAVPSCAVLSVHFLTG